MPANNHLLPAVDTQPRSQAIAGWLAGSGAEPAAIPKTAHIAGGVHTCLPIHCSSGDNYACAGTEPAHISDSGGAVGQIIGTPRWTTPLFRDIASEQGHAAALTAAYQAHGTGLTGHLRGAFAFALLDPAAGVVLLGTDRMGRFPLYYCTGAEGFIFGSTAHSVLAQLSATTPLRQQGVYDYVYFHMIPAPTTVYEGLHKLQAGCIAHGNAAKISTSRYWQPSFREQSNAARPALYKELKRQLQQAVSASLPAAGKVGAFLSGGLDSSTVTGMLAEVSSGPCDVYSIGFSAEGYDEMAFARITADHFGANLHEYYVTPDDVVTALPLIAGAYDEPFGNSSALPAYFCARLAAADGVTLLLAGDGGDEIFAGNERYAKQKTFELYQRVPEFLAKGLLDPLVRAAPAWLPLAEKARSYIDQANTPLPDRLHTYNFLHRHAATEIFQQSFLEQVDTAYPLNLLRDTYRIPAQASSLNSMLFLDWQFTLADNDLRKVSQTCALAGVEVAYPMLDDDLVEFSLGIPSDWKLPGNKLRDFYKKALTGWLPQATLDKSKQGFGLPFGVWMRSHRPLREIAYDNILKLKNRGLFNNAFLDRAIALHREGHAAYFGELIWILCVLELWLQKNLQ